MLLAKLCGISPAAIRVRNWTFDLTSDTRTNVRNTSSGGINRTGGLNIGGVNPD